MDRRATDHLQATRVEEEDGSVLRGKATNRSLELRGPLYLCYCCDGSRKVVQCIAVSDNKLNSQVDKLTMKISSSIDVLGPKQCEALEINGFSILCLDIKFNTEAAKCPKVDHIFSGLLQIHHVTDIRVCIDF
ncbi:hypothetical protein BVRB_016050 isoform B [Beta vulgaris subsp. vulgaris]|uniref:Uncharacterized protein n=1 Tax=Beta vulgaris subsp. vulgaris TaxID=3555 RepID=A0A0J8B4E3_BETVV|nr:hypothetical protein BVRB_016050 isoform B [Beta vulgaris subsp. vulgaris]